MKYIIFDLDDTLLNKKKEITPFTHNVLKKYQKAGHLLIINTARSLSYTMEYIDQLQPDYSILNGGSLIVDKNKNIIYTNCISKETSNALLKDLYTIVEKEGLSAETTDGMVSWHPETTLQESTYFDFSKPLNKACYKILPCCSNHELLNKLADKYNLDYIPYYGGEWGRFSNKDITKWSGVLALLSITNGSIEDTISFGDDTGDIEMLLNSHIGVAMENSQPNVLKVMKASKYNSNDDGVAKFLLDHIQL